MVDFLGTETMVAALDHVGKTACLSEMLKMSVKIPASWAVKVNMQVELR